MAMKGFATMYMRMPMSSSTLPVQGACTVDEKKVTLKFPFTGIEFELPSVPEEGTKDFDFKIRSQRGDLTLTISYVTELKCYTGKGIQEEETTPLLTFVFYPEDSPVAKLPNVQ